jgi:hypothetical protein
MNSFNDLVEELRDENLLEQTIIDLPGRRRALDDGAGDLGDDSADSQLSRSVSNDSVSDAEDGGEGSEPEESDERDFYRKRAMDEVSSLQMVEHVLSGIEREHMKLMSTGYDDLATKKALHIFLQVQGDTNTSEYTDAEFQLMHETEAWSSALSSRDSKISVSNLRRFCENSRPVLSSQALMALGRFYRNAAYSELSRAKFDFVMTRLFSREIDGEKRRVLFGRSDMIGHIQTLYANWASVALYSAEDVSLKTRAIIAGFEDRIAEADSALTFDQLIQNDFFKKVHEFKEATAEVFFTPEVVAAAIDCNTKIGNKFVDLVRLERERTNPESIEQKYGYEYDQIISDAAGKTLQLVEIAKKLDESDDPADEPAIHVETKKGPPAETATSKPRKPSLSGDLFQVNKWLLAATIVVLLTSGVLYFWSSQPTSGETVADSAKNVSLEASDVKEYIRSGRSTDETLYAITLPAWDQLDEDKKKDVLRKTVDVAEKVGLKNVQLINPTGRTVASASDSKVEIASSPK